MRDIEPTFCRLTRKLAASSLGDYSDAARRRRGFPNSSAVRDPRLQIEDGAADCEGTPGRVGARSAADAGMMGRDPTGRTLLFRESRPRSPHLVPAPSEADVNRRVADAGLECSVRHGRTRADMMSGCADHSRYSTRITRRKHSTRNGQIDKSINTVASYCFSELPDAPNCRCMSSPRLKPPSIFTRAD